MKTLVLFCVTLFAGHLLLAQTPDSRSAAALKILSAPRFDGNLNEDFWKQAIPVTQFIQREPAEGAPATEVTQVVFAYDQTDLWIGVRCYQSDMSKVVAKSFQRDFDEDGEDNVQIVISPFNDQRSGYLFMINPLGARMDATVSGMEETNDNWNGVWDARATRDDKGWYAEIRIPFNTLKFRNMNIQEWALNIERNIQSKNEQVRWQGWSRDHNLSNLAVAGSLVGIQDIHYSSRFEFKPYALGGWMRNNEENSVRPVGKIGGDLNYNLTSNLKLNLTVNTDFAQVEADQIQVNLTRFNLYYPEKREFFLEGDNYFSFNLGQSSRVFYTRKIGIENFEPVNVLGGVRLFGKEGNHNIGLLSLQTAANGSVPTTNNTVFRYKYDLGTQSYIGGIVTSKFNADKQNLVAGLDGSYTTSKLFGDKNLIAIGCVAASMDNGAFDKNNVAWRVMVDYPNELIDHYIGIASVPKGFNPELGFLGREDYDAINWHWTFQPRLLTGWGIRKLTLEPWSLVAFRSNTTKLLESVTLNSTPFGFQLKSGDSFEYSIQYDLDRPGEEFEITDDLTIPAGDYRFISHQFQLETFQGRRVWTEFDFSTGQFYSGRMTGLETSIGLNINQNLNLMGEYEFNQLVFGETKTWVHQVAAFLNYAFNTRIDLSLFGQWNNESDRLLLNFRIHWIPKIGSDFYFVLNNGYEPVHQAELLRPEIHSGAAKLVWRITF